MEVLDLDKGTFTHKLAEPQHTHAHTSAPAATGTNSLDNKSLFALYIKEKHNISRSDRAYMAPVTFPVHIR